MTSLTLGRLAPLALLPVLLFLSSCGESGPLAIDKIQLMNMEDDPVETIAPEDQEFKCVIKLNQTGSEAMIGMEMLYVEGEAEQSVITQEFKMEGLNNQVEFTISLPRPWPVGSYRIDAYNNDSLASMFDFVVK